MKRVLRTSLGTERTEVPGVLLYGLGQIGRMVGRCLCGAGAYEILGAVDSHPELAGRPLGEVLGLDDEALPAVSEELPLMAPPGAVALHMAGSRLPDIAEQVLELARMGYNVASSAEELCFPALQHPDIAGELDAVARACGVAIAGVGVNPGFVLDFLPVAAASMCRDIERVEAVRIVDAASRRPALQRKIGCGLTAREFERLADRGEIGHVGLIESCAFVADALGMDIDSIEEYLEPVIAEASVRTEHVSVESGQVCGIHHRAVGREQGRARVRLELQMYLNAPNPHDEINILGEPPVTLTIPAGTAGDSATVSVLINAIPRVAAAPAGLHTPRTLPFLI